MQKELIHHLKKFTKRTFGFIFLFALISFLILLALILNKNPISYKKDNLLETTQTTSIIPTTTVAPTPTPFVSDVMSPSVYINIPTNGVMINSSSNNVISAIATDNVGILKVEFYVDQKLLTTTMKAPFEYVWRVPDKKNTQYSIEARAYDTSGNTSSSFVHVYAK